MFPTDQLTASRAPVPMVLIVEDDPDVRSMAATAVDEVDADRAEAATAEDALTFLDDHAPVVRVIFTDVDLPGRLDGIELARVAALRWPWIKVLITTGGERIRDVPGNLVFLPKPCRTNDVRAQLQWEEARARATHSQVGDTAAH
jgi:two-component system, response regulator PdtaR